MRHSSSPMWGYEVALGPYSPALLALQQFAVSGDLIVEAQLGVHHLLVLLEQAGHVLLGLLQGLLLPGQLALGIVKGHLALLLCLCQGSLQLAALWGGKEKRSLRRVLSVGTLGLCGE